METQQVQRLVIGRGPAEDGLEEAEEELHGLTARHEDDHLVPLGKLHTHTHTHTHTDQQRTHTLTLINNGHTHSH